MTPETKKLIGNVLKTALVFTLIGAGLALGMPYVLDALHLAEFVPPTLDTVAGQGIFFGMFGTASAVLTPMVDSLFSKFTARRPDNTGISHETALAPALSHAHDISAAGHGHAAGYVDPGHAAAGHAAGLVEHAPQFAAQIEQARALQAAQPGIARIH